MAKRLVDIAKQTGRKELHWIAGKKQDLDVFRIPLQELYFNIQNGRYADRMFRLRNENPGVEIDPSKEKWATEIEKMLAGEHHDTTQDKTAFDKLISDIEQREQLRPGVAKFDGGVIDGNRRFAALRRLNRDNPRTNRFGFFEAVILPSDTTHEDLWRIEAGLQLGVEERWNYSPINELLKIREGLTLYNQLKGQGKHSGKTAVQLVAASIYGRSEADIEENAERLRLIDDYLAFIQKKGEYDVIGRVSERFLEANKILRAAKNQQLDAPVLAKLQAVLFYVIHTEKMDNWDLRKIYEAMGGDPKRKGRKPAQKNPKALKEFLAGFPEVRELRDSLTGQSSASTVATKSKTEAKGRAAEKGKTATAAKKMSSKADGKTGSQAQAGAVAVSNNADAAIDKLIVTMDATKSTKSPRQLVDAAVTNLNALVEALGKKQVRDHLEEDSKDYAAFVKELDIVSELRDECVSLLGLGKKAGSAKKASGARKGHSK